MYKNVILVDMNLYKEGDIMDKIVQQLKENGYDYGVAIATQSEIENGAACGQLSIIIDQEKNNVE